MKKVLLSVFILMLTLLTEAYAERPVKLYVGGEKVVTSDVAPKIVEGRTILPLRATFEAIGAEVSYDAKTRTVVAAKDDITVKLTIGEKVMIVNGEEKAIDVPAYIVNNRTMVPVRACAEAFNLKVDWFDKTRTVKIRKPISERSEIITNDGKWAKFTYDENGNLIYAESTGGVFVGQPDASWEKRVYDKNDNLIYWETSSGFWRKYEYNEFGNETLEEDSEGSWIKHEYDDDENVIYSEDYQGNLEKYSYDESGRVVYKEQYNGWDKSLSWWKYEYDENGNQTYFENDDGYWEKRKYDEYGSCIFIEDNRTGWRKQYYDSNGEVVKVVWQDGNEFYPQNYETKYEYDDKGNIIYEEDPNTKYWVKYKYDSNGNRIYVETSSGIWEKYEYDSLGNEILYQSSDGGWVKQEYDENGYLKYWRSSDGDWYKYTNDANGNHLIVETSSARTKFIYDVNGNMIESESEDGTITKYVVVYK